ncbi:MAG: phospholipase C, phosphocholine-specific [Saprospiraceae bacterium]|nr:phospholipase C, phosphocholine-specific [Saprospiraceae bacterium]
MENRREFLKKAAVLAGSAGFWGLLPESIQKALAIDPQLGTTYLDAEHIVVLMQENRSFDHAFGALQGVRGFDDPRAIQLPNGRPVWFQSNAAGETYAPFRLDIRDTQSTWMSSLPHSWTDQVDARNGGHYDRWLDAKRSGRKEYARMPLTLGYYTREDIPFYYALADAFTICDQHFCSSLTGTTPNRLYLWTGTARARPGPQVKANVRNEDVDYGRPANWKTYPERLEERGVSWKIYQNEISLGVGFTGEEDAWLANFTDNPLEWFEQYQVNFSPAHQQFLQKTEASLLAEIQALEQQIQALPADSAERQTLQTQHREKQERLARVLEARRRWSADNFARLSAHEKNLHEKAFSTNRNDPDYHSLSELTYEAGAETRQVAIPKGDILHQFRADVQAKTLPTVSWLVAPENFSDHPGAPWYGAWYVSEVLDILTQDPETWKKTIFILTYDENDGYFDHQPPFVPPHPDKPGSGKVSPDIDTSAEFVSLEQEYQRDSPNAQRDAREGPIGLGYRVPMLIASPWSRGGRVCSQVFDHTSVLQFLEHFLEHKTGQPLPEPNIGSWRRSICGNLTAAFRPYAGEKYPLPPFLVKDQWIETIHQARFKPVPAGFRPAQAADLQPGSPLLPRQEKGARPSCALPYELYADGHLNADKTAFELSLAAGNEWFGPASAGAPFQVYVPAQSELSDYRLSTPAPGTNRHYALSAGHRLDDAWALADFGPQGRYALHVYGPNGFYRAFEGHAGDPLLEVWCRYGKNGQLELHLRNNGRQAYTLGLNDLTYGYPVRQQVLEPQANTVLRVDVQKSQHWYDFRLSVAGFPYFQKRYAGRIETGQEGSTDPQIGRG